MLAAKSSAGVKLYSVKTQLGQNEELWRSVCRHTLRKDNKEAIIQFVDFIHLHSILVVMQSTALLSPLIGILHSSCNTDRILHYCQMHLFLLLWFT